MEKKFEIKDLITVGIFHYGMAVFKYQSSEQIKY